MVYGTLLNIHAYLVDVGPSNEILPEVAISWTPDPDTSRWVFELNPNARFSNGRSITSADVVASIAFHTADDSESGMKGQLAAITELTADGPTTVVMQLSERNADWPYFFSNYQLPILPSSDGTVDWQSGIGGGAYALESFEAGTSARLVRNPELWLEDRAWVDSVEIIAVNDPSARVQALLSSSSPIR
jgi:peptide/nickel transport system substrate-binding protein